MLSHEVAAGQWFAYAPLVIAFPILGLLANLAFGRRAGERFAGAVACAAVGLSFVVAVLQFLALRVQPEGSRVFVAEWIRVGTLSAPWALKVDSLSVTMMLMVTGVSALIHIYAVGYMHEDVRFRGDPGRYTRFFVYFNLFVAAMLVLVMGDSFLTLFVGWEGVGLCSYLLIGFWYEKGADGIGNAVAGKKAFIVNRIGDFGFLIAMFLVFRTFGSLQLDEVFRRAATLGPAAGGVLTAITLFMLLAITGKSAQLPLFVWLPDAMAGPTPVSALIHAATMVTAGVYLTVRTHPLFALAPVGAEAVVWVGAITAFFAATIALGQYDIKSVLAYSTISQLGFMVSAAGMGASVAAIFHLLTHAFFKALLFLSAGSVIHGGERGHQALAHHTQGEPFDPNDMRAMGGLATRMRTTFAVYLVGAVALAGLPPLAGFFSKDEILAAASIQSPAVFALLAAAALLTALYVGRQILLVFFGRARSEAAAHAVESPAVMTLPLVAFALLACLGGALNLPGIHTLTHWLGLTVGEIQDAPFNLAVAALSTSLALIAAGVAWLVYGRNPLEQGAPDPLRRLLGPIFSGIEQRWKVDEFYDWLVVRRYVALAGFLADVIDVRFWHDWFHDTLLARSFRQATRWLAEAFDLHVIDAAANGLASLTQSAAQRLRRLQTGYVRNYALSFLLGAVVLIGYFLLR